LARRYDSRPGHAPIQPYTHYPITPFEYNRRFTRQVINIGGEHHIPRVIADFSWKDKVQHASLFSVGYHYSVPLDKWNIADMACDYIYLGDNSIDFEIPGTLGLIYNYSAWQKNQTRDRAYPLLTREQYMSTDIRSAVLNFIQADIADLSAGFIDKLKADPTAVLIMGTHNQHGMAEQRRLVALLMEHACDVPVLISRTYDAVSPEQLQLWAATDIGGLLVDGLGDGVFIRAHGSASDKQINETAFNILQATRTRISKTEYISCPSCGRTLFDLQETTANIRSRTSHLKGIKIGIMGCIVNGPGEMADADYGYVGSGPGRITLYKGKEVVRRNVPTAKAVDELVDLIREHGDWIELETTIV
jgi:(E)-4-hydroxy-3-methylbut-2-enyl-diphosphate synthase